VGRLPGSAASVDTSCARRFLCDPAVQTAARCRGLKRPLRLQVSASDVAAFLGSCQHPDGGFGGGPQQLPHLAPTYAAVAALATLGGPALDVVDRAGVARFIRRMAVPAAQGGGFQVCDGAALRCCCRAET